MAKYSIEDTTLTGIANAIRNKTGKASSIKVSNMATEIAGIDSGSGSGGSGGGSVETCTVSLSIEAPIGSSNMTFYYTTPEMSVESITYTWGDVGDIEVVKGTIVAAGSYYSSTSWTCNGEIVPISGSSFIINGDCAIEYIG